MVITKNLFSTLTVLDRVVVVRWPALVATVCRFVVRLGARVNELTLAFEFDQRFPQRRCLLFQVWMLKLFDGLDPQLRAVVEEELAESVAFKEAKAPVRAALPELEQTYRLASEVRSNNEPPPFFRL